MFVRLIKNISENITNIFSNIKIGTRGTTSMLEMNDKTLYFHINKIIIGETNKLAHNVGNIKLL